MSPQSRRGRATPASHHKSSAKPAADAAKAPANAQSKPQPQPKGQAQQQPKPQPQPKAAAAIAQEPESTVAARHHTAAPGVRRRRSTPVRSNSVLRNIYAYVKVYIPLFVAFVLLFAGVWAWVSFGPHTTTPNEHWTQIETKWKSKVLADKDKANTTPTSDFAGQVTAYKSLREDLNSWVTDLAAVTSWSDAQPSTPASVQVGLDVAQMIQYGKEEVTILDQFTAATSASTVLAQAQNLADADTFFWQEYEVVFNDLGLGASKPSLAPTLAVPPGSPSASESAGASGSPGASAPPASVPSVTAVPSPS